MNIEDDDLGVKGAHNAFSVVDFHLQTNPVRNRLKKCENGFIDVVSCFYQS